MLESRKTVLIVDDIPEEIIIIDEILKREYTVKAVTSGAAALSVARRDPPPDLILLDIMMPGMDGFEVCRNLKSDSAGTSIPVIFLTARRAGIDEKTAFQMGAADYIRKPVDPELLLGRVKAHLEQKDELVRVSEVRYRRLFETSTDGIMIIDAETGAIVDVNPAMASLLELSLESFLNRRLSDLDILTDITFPKGRLSILQRHACARSSGSALVTANGRKVYVESNCSPYFVNGREMLQLNLRDVTELTIAEQTRDDLAAKLDHYLSTSPTITFSLKLENGVAQTDWVSGNITRILGYSQEEVYAPDWWFRNLYPDDRGSALNGISELSKGDCYSHAYRFLKKDRTVIWILDELRLVRNPGGVREIVGTLLDITERKRSEEQLRQKSEALERSLAERNVLLREIHHRVKNNMQVISSLLSLSAGTLQDPSFVSTIDAVIRRIGAMAVAHERVYESEDMVRFDFSQYLKELCRALVDGSAVAPEGLKLEYEADTVMLNLEDAIPAGLIVSELVSNAVRHAIAGAGTAVTVSVCVRRDEQDVAITVADDGEGFPAGFDPVSSTTLGMRLVRILAEQLHGTVTFGSNALSGVAAELRFRPSLAS